MCGIAGVYGRSDPELVRRMIDVMRYRGPDAHGIYNADDCTLGHTRLSIIDIEGGAQPMCLPGDQDTCITYNGEVYNFLDLRAGLDSRFNTRSDTEVILRMYERHGPRCVETFDGMFAFALYNHGDLLLARDPLGIKPLYWAREGDTLYFASEIKALRLASERVREFPNGCIFTPGSGVQKFFTFPNRVLEGRVSVEGHVARLSGEVDAAVRKRLIADVPVGSFLSGGVDSSLAAALASSHHGDMHTFSTGVEGAPDLGFAWEAAEHIGTIHHEHVFSREDVIDALPQVIYHLETYDPPLVRSAIPNYFVSGLASRYVKVVLSGEGADELFAGYDYIRGMDVNAESYRITTNLHNLNLQRTDRMTMAHSIEGRVPFLDVAVVRHALTIPAEMKVRGDTGKWILRKVAESHLPRSIAWRKKQKFSSGAGSMFIFEEIAEREISDAEFERARISAGIEFRSKEELYFYRVFEERFGAEAVECLARTRDYDRIRADT